VNVYSTNISLPSLPRKQKTHGLSLVSIFPISRLKLANMPLLNLFKKPPGYVIASILCSMGGFLFGVDTGIIGPVTVMEDFTRYVGNPSPTIHGLIVSSILIPAAISSFFAGKVADHLGRTRGIAIGSFIFAVGAALEAASVHIGMFVVGRVIEGIGEGLYLGTIVV
jgi:MFS family permease